MKSKIAFTVLILSCSTFMANGKSDFFSISPPCPPFIYPDSSNFSFSPGLYYYHINYGDSIGLKGEIHIWDDGSLSYSEFPPDSVHWYCNGNFIGVTFGYQIKYIIQAGTYTATAYSGNNTWIPGTYYQNDPYNIFLTVLNPTSIAVNSNSQLVITQNANENSLSIKGLPETGNHSVEICSVTGALVKKEILPAHRKEYFISLATVNRGFYIIRISDDKQIFSRKLFIE